MPTNLQKARELFLHAVGNLPPEKWEGYVSDACSGDADLEQQVGCLLQVHREAGSFLEAPAHGLDATLNQPLVEKPGTQIGPYKLLQQIGVGGMGVVWMAEQTQPVQRKVALKLIKPGMDSRQIIARFEAERQALAMMDHVNIARVLDAGATESGRPYFVMELVHGVPITKYCDDNHLTPRERLELFVPVCQAIQHAHQKGIIHRDIKPSNVMITLYDGKPVPKVIDFGVAKAIEQKLTERTLFTQYGTMVGTLEYMSPEQAEMSALGVDTRSDIYSLGVLLYELLTGSTPLSHKRVKEAAYAEILRMIKEEEPQKPSTRLSDSGEALASISANRHMEPAKLSKLVRGELDWIVMKTLEKDRNRRYETANGFAADVQRYLNDETVQACPPSAMYRFRKFARRNKVPLATASAVSVAVVLALVSLAVSNVRISREKQQKEIALTEKGAALSKAKSNYEEAQKQEKLASQNAQRAEEQSEIARANEKTAKAQTLLASRRFYASQMNLATQAWRAGEMPRVLELLEGQRPAPDEEDLRSFEWYYLWRLCNGGHRLYLHSNTEAVLSVAFSPDGKTLASGSWDDTVRLWDAGTGRERSTLRGHSKGVWTVAFSPDGKTLASGGKETGSLILWDASTGKTLHTLTGSVDGFAFSHDSKFLAGGVIKFLAGGVVSDTGTHVKLWDVSSGAERATLADAGHVVGLLADGKTLVTLKGRFMASSEIQFWDVTGGTRRMIIPVPRLSSAVLSPDGTTIATACSSGNELWDTATGKKLTAFSELPNGPGRLAFSSDGKRLACGIGRNVIVIEIATGRRLVQDVHLDPVGGVAFSPDGKMLASSTIGGAIRLWDMARAEEATTIPSISGATSLRFALDGRTLLVGTSGPTKRIDVTLGKELAELPVSGVLAMSYDANTLAHSVGETTAASWDVRTGSDTLGIEVGAFSGAAVSPNGKTVATFRTLFSDTSVRLWDVATRQSRILKISPPESNRISIHCAEYSLDGKLLAAGYQFQWVTVWDVATGEVKLQFSQKPAMMNVVSLAFSPDNQALAVGTHVGAVTLWELETGRRLASFKGHASAVFSLAFSSDGTTLATAGADQTVRLWDVLTGQERSTLTGHKGAVRKVQFSPDGKILATASADGTVKLWRAATDPAALARRTILDSDDPNYAIAQQANFSAWELATTADPAERNPAKTVELAQKAVSLAPRAGRYWLTLGVAQYRAGQWREAIAALEKSQELSPGTYTGFIGFVHAMASWKLDYKDEAQKSYDGAVQWTDQYTPDNPKLHAFHVEAAELLGMPAPRPLPVLPPTETDTESALRPIRLQPDNASAHTALGEMLRDRKHDYEGAIICFKKAVELDPKNAAVHLQLGILLEKQGKLDEAVLAFRQAIDLNPQDASSYRNLAFILLDLNKSNQVIDRLRKAAEINPSAATAYMILGCVLREKKKPDDAVACFQRAIELDPNSAESYCFVGHTLLDNYEDPRKWDEAAAYFQKGIEMSPKHLNLRWGLGRALHWQKKLDDAVACFHVCLERDPNHSASHSSLGFILLDQQKPEQAVVSFRKAIALDPNHCHFQYGLALALMELKEHPEEAIAALRRSIELDPKRAYVHYQLGVLLRQQNQSDDALACFRMAVELNPQHPVAHGHLGSILAIQGKTDEGMALMRKAVELNPKLASSHAELAWHLATAADLKLRDSKAAVSHARTATELQSGQPNHWRNLGVALLRDGDHKAAAEALEKFEEMTSGKTHHHGFFLAMAYWQLGERDKAGRTYEQAVQWMEKNSPTSHELHRFRAEAEELLKKM